MPTQAQPRPDGPYAMYVIIAGLFAVTAVTIGALVRYADATDIVTALGPVTGVIGTLVGAYFGMRGSSLAQQHALEAEKVRASAAAPPEPSTNGHGDAATIPQFNGAPVADDAANGVQTEFAAMDATSDPDHDLEVPDPEDQATDDPPDDEGDDREVTGVKP